MSVDHLVGHQLGQYTLNDVLGSGGMGAVYRAYQPSLTRDVAIKVLPTDLADQPGYLARFAKEARISASLEHAHIVPVYDYGVQDKQSYVVMRLLTGGTLGDWLRDAEQGKRPRPTLEQTVQILKQLADALDYAHQRGVVHRDVKPGNIMFDDVGNVYLVDFGIAKLGRPDTPTTGTDPLPTLGTPAYMSPEQWRSEPLTPAADQYALAVVAYVLLAGKLPFDAETLYQMMHKHLNDAPTPLQAFRADLPLPISTVLERALSKEPEGRFPSVSAFADAFAQAVDGGGGIETNPELTAIPPQVYSDTTPHLRFVERKPLPRSALLLGGLVGLLAVAAVAFVLLQPPQNIAGNDPIGTSNALPTRTAISVASPIPNNVVVQPTSVTSIAMTLTALRSDALTRAPRPTDLPVAPTNVPAVPTDIPVVPTDGALVPSPLPGIADATVIGPVIGSPPLPQGVPTSSSMPTPEPGNLPGGYLRADLLGQIFRLNSDGVPFIYAFEPPDFTGQEPYLTVNVDNYPAYYHPYTNAMPIGYLTKNHSYPIVQTANGYAFVRGSKFSGWVVIDPKVMTIYGNIDTASQ